jgi:hypothetical protein
LIGTGIALIPAGTYITPPSGSGAGRRPRADERRPRPSSASPVSGPRGSAAASACQRCAMLRVMRATGGSRRGPRRAARPTGPESTGSRRWRRADRRPGACRPRRHPTSRRGRGRRRGCPRGSGIRAGAPLHGDEGRLPEDHVVEDPRHPLLGRDVGVGAVEPGRRGLALEPGVDAVGVADRDERRRAEEAMQDRAALLDRRDAQRLGDRDGLGRGCPASPKVAVVEGDGLPGAAWSPTATAGPSRARRARDGGALLRSRATSTARENRTAASVQRSSIPTALDLARGVGHGPATGGRRRVVGAWPRRGRRSRCGARRRGCRTARPRRTRRARGGGSRRRAGSGGGRWDRLTSTAM